MNVKFTLNDLQRQRVEDHLALVEQVLRRSIKTNETVDGMGYDDLYQEGCIALCRASVSYREEMGSFPAYAKVVIRNHLLDRCREIQSTRKNLPLVSLDAFAEMGVPEPVSPFHTEDLISDVSSDALLSHFRNRYHGTARLGIEAMELRVRGYSCADIAKLYQKKPNYIGACISRAAESCAGSGSCGSSTSPARNRISRVHKEEIRMAEKTLYTALGHFRCRHDKGRRYPVILMDHHEFGMDPQEMTLWTALCWRLTDQQRAEDFYEQLSNGMELFPRRSFSDCLDRLVTRGLVAKGSGTTDFDALYDLLGGLYVVPISSSFPLKVVTFLKLLRSGTAPALAATLFRRDRRTEPERCVMALSGHTPLSTAELVRCAERGVPDTASDLQMLDLLYGDQETTSDNIVSEMRTAACCRPVTTAVANLYLRKQIIFERACA